MKSSITALGLALVTVSATAAQQIYCPQHAGYISIGMSAQQVIANCGEPVSKEKSNTPIMQQVPIQQLIYNNQGAPKAFYGVWALPGGNSTQGLQPFGGNSGGSRLEVDVMDEKVTAVRINGSSSNAFSICNGTSIQIGDPASKVSFACGSPSLVNNSFVNKPIVSTQKPEVWVYQMGQYQSPISLTFIDGKLQSINN